MISYIKLVNTSIGLEQNCFLSRRHARGQLPTTQYRFQELSGKSCTAESKSTCRTSAGYSKHQGCPRPAGAGPPAAPWRRADLPAAAPASHFTVTACLRQSLTEERSSGSRRAPWRSWSRGWRCFELEKGAVSY